METDKHLPPGVVEVPHDPVATAQRAMDLAGRYQCERDEARHRADDLERLVRAAAPFVNAMCALAEDKTPSLAWLADASSALPTFGSPTRDNADLDER